jgi:hypothetical protein
VKIVDMKRARPKGKDGDMAVPWGGEEEGPRVHLDHDRMKKVGMSKPPATGDEYHIQGHARVVGSREEPSSDGKSGPVHSIEIVIHHMGAEPKGADDGKSVRDNIEEAAEGVEKREAKTARTDKKIPEKPEGK